MKKYINELLNKSFVVPNYQRNYKWGKDVIEYLLKDIKAFKESKSAYYCLQPLVISKAKDAYRIIDGQQRLTTIFLILKVLQHDELFELEYETRIKSKEVLQNIEKKKQEANENVDFYFMFQAYETIKKWIEKEIKSKDELKAILLYKTAFIWYEVKEKDEITIFRHINNKIPLTDSECIKALFFANDDNATRFYQWQIMQEDLEKAEFLGLFYPGKDYITNMDWLFEIYVALKQPKHEQSMLSTFHNIERELTQHSKDKTWNEIQEIYNILKEWYCNNTIYHYIGFLCYNRNDNDIEFIANYIQKYKNKKSKEDFITTLKGDIKQDIKKSLAETKIEDLDYNENPIAIRKILMFFNIQSMLNKNMRFPFLNFQEMQIEHINPQTPLKDLENKQKWFKMQKQYNRKKLEEAISKIPDKQNKAKFEALLNTADDKAIGEIEFEEIEENLYKKHTLHNLTLLSSSLNSQLSNKLFYEKREIIIKHAKENTFILPCTFYAFMKCYSTKNPCIHIWNEDDGDEYIKAIYETLKSGEIQCN